ncbi:hypothetical protein FBY06_11588 [Pseudomonas sp. SJZ085]|uniref:hypothetical protein n=1 Tax=unclassified Pseudomonas TaxID=196821 RepID=UPI00119B22A0|nr:MULTISPECIES: hypothetical protein [unclassified Pseudomonas]TWC18163.1 hypothetical protein FBX99_11588 [Pseudomonas sp. SJZ074]TWC36135.1 hypothetical protein FBY06_11588 [Pseudomonas sp. SJZ085]
MDSVKSYHVGDAGLVEGEALGRITVYLAADFDRVSEAYVKAGEREHELQLRIAQLEQSEKQMQETVGLVMRTGARVIAERDALQQLLNQRDEAIHDLEQRRHAEQQACQAAEQRVEELRDRKNSIVALQAALAKAREWLGDGKYADGLHREHWTPEYAALIDCIDAALNPTAEAASERAEDDRWLQMKDDAERAEYSDHEE